MEVSFNWYSETSRIFQILKYLPYKILFLK